MAKGRIIRMHKDYLEQNLEAMEKWYPEFVELLKKAESGQDDVEVLVETSWDNELIFRLRKGERMLYLDGKRNAKEPIRLWIDRLGKVPKYAPVFLFGVGSGSYLKALIKHTEPEVNVVVYEPSLTIFMKMLEEVDLTEQIKDRPIAFIVNGINEEEFKPVMAQLLVLENMEFLISEVHPNYREFYGEEILDPIRILQRNIENMMMNYQTGLALTSSVATNIISNMPYALEGYNTKKLYEAVPHGGPAILVSAGPSLNKNIQELKKAKNKAFILAVDTAVKPLLKAGIVPDAYCTLDAKKANKLTEMEEIYRLPIVSPVFGAHSMLERQTGKRIFYIHAENILFQMYLEGGQTAPMVASGGSVACSGFSLLYKMGFQTIILVGQDLALTGNKSHADGTFEDKMPTLDTTRCIQVKGNYEDKVPTRRDLRSYIEWFEEYIEGMKAHNNVRVINATEGGAYIEGAELMTLSDAIAECCCVEEVDFAACIENMESAFDDHGRKGAVAYLHTIPEGFEAIAKYAIDLRKAYAKLEKMGKAGTEATSGSKKQLKKIKRLTKKIENGDPACYQLVNMCLPAADFVVRSEYFYEEEEQEMDELAEIGRKGVLYSELLEECANLLKGVAEEYLTPLEA